MADVVADTHAFVWYVTERDRLSLTALRALDQAAATGGVVFVSAVSLVEITYLTEKGRLPSAVSERIDHEMKNPDVAFRIAPLDENIARAVAAVAREKVPDMPDRIIAATALHLGVPLVTRDGRIRTSGIETIW